MRTIGWILIIAGVGAGILAFVQGRNAGVGVTEGPPPPSRSRILMGSAIGMIIAGIVLATVANT